MIATAGPGHMWVALRRWLLPRRAAAPPVAAMSDLQAMPTALQLRRCSAAECFRQATLARTVYRDISQVPRELMLMFV